MNQTEAFDSVFAHRNPLTGQWNVGLAAEGNGSAVVTGKAGQDYDAVFAIARKAFVGQLQIAKAVAA